MFCATPDSRLYGHVLRWIGKCCLIPVTFEQVTFHEEPKRVSEISASRWPGFRFCFFSFVVFVQTSIQRIALLIDTVTETLAGDRAVTGPAPIRAFCFLIAGPDVEQEIIEDDY